MVAGSAGSKTSKVYRVANLTSVVEGPVSSYFMLFTIVADSSLKAMPLLAKKIVIYAFQY